MNKLIKITLVTILFTSIAAKAEEMSLEASHEATAQEEVINHFESIPGYEANAAEAQAEEQEEVLDEAVSSHDETELPQS